MTTTALGQPKLQAFRNTPGLDPVADDEKFSTIFAPHRVVLVAAPNFTTGDERLQALPSTKNALAAVFGQKAIDVDASAASGFALKADGSMKLDDAMRISYVTGSYNAGLATSRYDVAGSAAHLLDETTAKSSNENARDLLPQLISPSHRVSLERSQDINGNNSYSIFVTANDIAAAKTLRQTIEQRAAERNTMTLHELVESAEYKRMLDAAQCKRDVIAQHYATAHQLKLTSSRPSHTTAHYSIAAENTFAHGQHESLAPPTGAKSEPMYVVYNNTSNAAFALNGSLVSHGILGGHTLVESSTPKPDGASGQTYEWHQKDFLSHLPTTSVAFHTVHSKVAARHRNESDETKKAFANRVVWTSELTAEHVHPQADEKFNAMTDPFSARWLEKLNEPEAAPLRQTNYHVVLAQLPDVTTAHLTADQLIELAKDKSAPANIPVNIDNELVGRITQKWNQIRDPYAALVAGDAASSTKGNGAPNRDPNNKARLRSIFSNVFENRHADEMQMTLSGAHALCTLPGHAHANTATLSPPGTIITLDKRLILLLAQTK